MKEEFNTSITINGKPSDIRKALKMLTEEQAKYHFKNLRLPKFPNIDEVNVDRIDIKANGPYCEETQTFFTDLAWKIPDAYFSGIIEGFDSLGKYHITKGILSEGMLKVFRKTGDKADCLNEDNVTDWDDKTIHSVKTIILV